MDVVNSHDHILGVLSVGLSVDIQRLMQFLREAYGAHSPSCVGPLLPSCVPLNFFNRTVDVNPLSSPFCLTLPHSPARWPHPPLSVYSPSSSHQFHVPILVNNSVPYEVTYEITPL